WTIFSGWLDQSSFGKGPSAISPIEDNLERVDEWVLWDKRPAYNHENTICLYYDVPDIITDILSNGAQLAVVSCNTSKALCDRALWLYKTMDPETRKQRPIIEMVNHDEVYNQSKKVHFTNIHDRTKIEYSDMVLFDDEAVNNEVTLKLGVTFQVSRNQKGLTWDNYRQGIDLWRRCKLIRSPYLGQDLRLYSNKKFIGYAGMDQDTIDILEKGKNRIDITESARWGYAMYITDNPAIAKYFSEWIKEDSFGKDAKTHVCALWVRDGDCFDRVGKIWVPEFGHLQTDNKHWDATTTAWKQEDRDCLVASWGVKTPYILFSRHHWMEGMPIPEGTRWNEMAVYPQIQDALFLTQRLTTEQLDESIKKDFCPFDQQIKAWNITVPEDTRRDFVGHAELFIKI
ncbi:acid phosphatase-domain-containing protein, partial [Pisolithus albus]